MKSYLCPWCKQTFTEKSRYAPFCCERCQTLDLGGWVTERYALAGKSVEEEDEKDITGQAESDD